MKSFHHKERNDIWIMLQMLEHTLQGVYGNDTKCIISMTEKEIAIIEQSLFKLEALLKKKFGVIPGLILQELQEQKKEFKKYIDKRNKLKTL